MDLLSVDLASGLFFFIIFLKVLFIEYHEIYQHI